MTEARLNDEEITARLAGSPWTREGDAITLQREFSDFADTMAAVNRVAAVAEAANHHPDILLHGWNKLKLTLTDHSAGGLTAVDFEVAERLDGSL